MQERGTILVIEGAFAEVEIARHSACKGCQACAVTGSGTMLARVRNVEGARPGDHVTLTIDDSRVLKAAAVVYLVPLLAMIAGFSILSAGAALVSLPAIPAGIAGAVAGVAAAVMWISRYDRSAAQRGEFHLTMEIEGGKEGPSAS